VQCTKINWTITVHRTCDHLVSVLAYTSLCGYGLSVGPLKGLSSWWPSDPVVMQPRHLEFQRSLKTLLFRLAFGHDFTAYSYV